MTSGAGTHGIHVGLHSTHRPTQAAEPAEPWVYGTRFSIRSGGCSADTGFSGLKYDGYYDILNVASQKAKEAKEEYTRGRYTPWICSPCSPSVPVTSSPTARTSSDL